MAVVNERKCQFCKSSKYGYCRLHFFDMPAELRKGMGWRVTRGKSSFHDSRKLFTLQDFLNDRSCVAHKDYRDSEGNIRRKYFYSWVPLLPPNIVQAAPNPKGCYKTVGVKDSMVTHAKDCVKTCDL